MSNARQTLSGLMCLLLLGGLGAAVRAAEAPPAAEAPAAEAPAVEAPATEAPAAEKPARLWDAFLHWGLMARLDLAKGYGESLLKLDDQQFLDIVEASEAGDRADWDKTLHILEKTEGIKDLADQVRQKIQRAAIARSRDEARIIADIRQLGGEPRARTYAVARLKAAGQYAAPQLMKFLTDDKERSLHARILDTLVVIGRPMVYPLSIALAKVEPAVQVQLAQVLANIGYPQALPFLKELLDQPGLDANARRALQAAYNRMVRDTNLPEKVTAAELHFHLLAQRFYANASAAREELPGYDVATGKGLIWTYDLAADPKLAPLAVPGDIFGEVLAMRACQRALKLDPKMDAALSLWLAANLRRENRLPEGQTDPSYSSSMKPPAFYARMANPVRMHEVLEMALRDGDVALALDAIEALGAVAGTEVLVNRVGAAQPLIDALFYPNVKVRFAAAKVMTNARPQDPFAGSFRVVPVLAEAVRKSATRTALVLASDQEAVNKLKAALADPANGAMRAEGGTSLSGVVDLITALPGFDVVVISQPADKVDDVLREIQDDYKLKALPVVVVAASPSDAVEIGRRYIGRAVRPRVADSLDKIKPVLDEALAAYAGTPLSEEEAQQFALTALALLRDVALARGEVFRVNHAQPALVAALTDSRDAVASGAAAVLAMIDDAQAQQALAEAALGVGRSDAVRIAYLNALAQSAAHYGNKITKEQVAKLLTLTREAQGDLAVAAARAVGGLALETAQLVP